MRNVYLLFFITLFMLLYSRSIFSQKPNQLLPFRPQMPNNMENIERIDFDNDGDPNAIKYTVHNNVPVM